MIMICPHGLSEEMCLHCQVQMRQRSPLNFRLSTIGNIEIPIPEKFGSDFKKMLTDGMIEPTKNISPPILNREMDLRRKFFQPSNTMLESRLKSIDNEEIIAQLNPEVPLFDIKKKFLQ